ncbi:PSMC3 interacting protein [Rhizophlyctis rosea]|uniref:Homologous-pairing protein 2 homolog n=1 Tax=Rhizophlyctis rosea TaxID=64517 RepID=A0AAD5X240_9FUNG|nr:PSMC3 interacting protein [Rhizophlyctis rosea]
MGKPKKPAASATSASGEPQDVVLTYLRRTNRPYSAVDVFNNLKGEIGKTIVTKTLAQLVDEQTIHGKQYGKQWVYVAKQDELPAPSQDELDTMDERMEALKAEVSAVKDEIKQSQSTLNGLESSLTNDQIVDRLRILEEENKNRAARLNKLRDNPVQMSSEDKKRIETGLESMRTEWRKRKRMFKDMWDAVTENLPGDRKELMEEIGIETDESVGLDYNEDPVARFMES